MMMVGTIRMRKVKSLGTRQIRTLSWREKIEERSRSSDEQTQIDFMTYFLFGKLNAFPR